MTPTTAILIGIIFSVLSFLGTMLLVSVRVGEYKRMVNELGEKVVMMQSTIDNNQRSYLAEVVSLARSIGKLEGQLERINGKH